MNTEWKIPKQIHIPPKKKNAQMVQTATISKNLHPAYSKKKKNQKRSKRKKENRQRTFS